MEQSINERINTLYKYSKERSIRSFAIKLGVAPTTLNECIKGSEPRYSLLNSILSGLPSISPAWLLTGKGEMLKSSSTGDGNISTSIHGNFTEPIFADVKNTMGDTVIGHNAQNKSNNNIQTSSNEELLRAKMEIEYLQKENEKLNVSLERAIADKERAMAMLEKILNK